MLCYSTRNRQAEKLYQSLCNLKKISKVRKKTQKYTDSILSKEKRKLIL